MTKEQVIMRLKNIERCTPIHTQDDIYDFKALEIAISELVRSSEDSRDKTITDQYLEQIEKIKQEMRDEYCRFPVETHIPDALDKYCKDCPLTKLQEKVRGRNE